MFADQIEKMKREYTDKYVLVDDTRPELARFRDIVGRVKTVNMSGRALVEFDDYHLNIAWYDIAPEFLKVVDKPPPKAPKPEAKKAAPKAAPAEKAPAAPKPAAAGAAKAGKQSVADILAAARGGQPAAAPPPKAKVAAPAAEKSAAPKADRGKMSVADMLAAARAGGAPGAAPATPKTTAPANAAPVEEAEEESAPEPAPAPAKKAPAAKSAEKIDKSKMTIDDMLAWCRQHDAK